MDIAHKITLDVVDDILEEIDDFLNSSEKELCVDLPTIDDFYTFKKFNGSDREFIVEIFLFKSTFCDKYVIDADSPGDDSENNIRFYIYLNPKKIKTYKDDLYFNLIYTFRHEFEHLLQVYTNYENIKYTPTKKYRGDSLKSLMKLREIEPQVYGYLLQSKIQKVPFESVIRKHLSQMEDNCQITFKNEKRKEILIKTILEHSKFLGLTSNS
jgi:hypothetical protein